jgi:hypothetical protein
MTTTTETKPALPKCEPSATVDMLVPPSEVTEGDLMLVQGTLSSVLAVPTQDAADGPYARFVVEHETFPGPNHAGDVYVRWEGLVAIRRYITGEAAARAGAGYRARSIAQDLTSALTGHGSVEVDRDMGYVGEQLTGLIEAPRDTLEAAASALGSYAIA